MITLTEQAGARIKQVLAQREKDPGTALRLFVHEGGCSGFHYGMQLESDPSENDRVIEQHGVRLVLDPVSAMYLQGAKMDYVENLMGGGFTIQNPNAQQTCGCGQSFRTKKTQGKPQACDDDEEGAD